MRRRLCIDEGEIRTFRIPQNEFKDSGGLRASATVTVTVLAPTPKVFITYPASGATIPSGLVYLKGYATNPLVGDKLTCDELVWRISVATAPSVWTLTNTISGCDAEATEH